MAWFIVLSLSTWNSATNAEVEKNQQISTTLQEVKRTFLSVLRARFVNLQSLRLPDLDADLFWGLRYFASNTIKVRNVVKSTNEKEFKHCFQQWHILPAVPAPVHWWSWLSPRLPFFSFSMQSLLILLITLEWMDKRKKARIQRCCRNWLISCSAKISHNRWSKDTSTYVGSILPTYGRGVSYWNLVQNKDAKYPVFLLNIQPNGQREEII